MPVADSFEAFRGPFTHPDWSQITNRELLAQGVGNVASGRVGRLPITQVIVRRPASIQSWGPTKATAIIHGLLLVVFALP